MGAKKTKVIIISQVELPYSKIGSWTTMYHNYINSNLNKIDIIICPQTKKLYPNIEYGFYKNKVSLIDRIFIKFKVKNPWFSVFSALKKKINKNQNYIIKIVDNYGIIPHLNHFLKINSIREKCKIIYFYHGFDIIFKDKNTHFFLSIDKMVFLTQDSYQLFKNYYKYLPKNCSVLHNGIDTEKFFPISEEEKEIQKLENKIGNKLVFIWCSQDRPKKGLDLILQTWSTIYQKYSDKVVLLVVGTQRKINQKGVINLGRIPNSQLVKYFQMSDCYLFPTLWKEGFGMSLIEAKHCGCYCIASSIGGVPEVLSYGKYGVLIDNFNSPEEWIKKIATYINNREEKLLLPKKLYTSITWNKNMNLILEETT